MCVYCCVFAAAEPRYGTEEYKQAIVWLERLTVTEGVEGIVDDQFTMCFVINVALHGQEAKHFRQLLDQLRCVTYSQHGKLMEVLSYWSCY